MKTLRHATPSRNDNSIRATGLRTRFATGKRKAVWFHECGRSLWAIEHVSKRHHCRPADVLVYLVHLDETSGKLKRGPHGTWYYEGDVSAEAITGRKTAHELLNDAESW